MKDRQEEPMQAFVVLPYMKGVTVRLQRAYKQHSIQFFCKAGYVIRNAVVCLKDPLDTEENVVQYMSASARSVDSCMWGRQ